MTVSITHQQLTALMDNDYIFEFVKTTNFEFELLNGFYCETTKLYLI